MAKKAAAKKGGKGSRKKAPVAYVPQDLPDPGTCAHARVHTYRYLGLDGFPDPSRPPRQRCSWCYTFDPVPGPLPQRPVAFEPVQPEARAQVAELVNSPAFERGVAAAKSAGG